jgi:protein-tyrosine phosphatase
MANSAHYGARVAAPFRILTVCTANVCRSALAEVLLQRELAAAGVVDVIVESSGTHADPGQPMCEAGAAFAGIEPPTHVSRELDAEQLMDADLVLAADRTHRAACARLAPACRPRLFTMRQAAALADVVAGHVRQGELPEGAPPLPGDAADRLRWLVSEMDAARGAIAGRDEASDDIEDRHGPADHTPTLVQVQDAAGRLTAALAACAAQAPGAPGAPPPPREW